MRGVERVALEGETVQLYFDQAEVILTFARVEISQFRGILYNFIFQEER